MEVQFERAVRDQIYDHVFESLDSEVAGVLVGPPQSEGPLCVTGSVKAVGADSQSASVTFTQDSWSAIYEALEADHPDESIVGWYHSHPDFGIFLSDHDTFIHRSFFSGQRQVAYVVDPCRGREGLFGWRNGDIERLQEGATTRAARRPTGQSRGGSAAAERRARGLALPAVVAAALIGVLVGGAGGMVLTNDAPVAAPAILDTTQTDAADAANARVTELEAALARLKSRRETSPAALRTRHHRVRRGETLSGLAQRFYGDPAAAWLLAGANGLTDLDAVSAGDMLFVLPREIARENRRTS